MKKLVRAVLLAQETLGTVLLGVFFIAIVLQIAARYLQIPLLWTEEVANYSFIWAVFMGASAMVYHRAHFSFSFFRDRFRGRAGACYSTGISLVLLAFTIAMTIYGIMVVEEFWDYNWITVPQMSMGITWLCLPLMGITMSLYSLKNIVDDLALAFAKEAA
ncbi:MAG: TRAP transporter small permease subunit [Planctomycetes bacterium]|nr:TRAP transporter small permease subunit [Planctomycetota bacterium]